MKNTRNFLIAAILLLTTTGALAQSVNEISNEAHSNSVITSRKIKMERQLPEQMKERTINRLLTAYSDLKEVHIDLTRMEFTIVYDQKISRDKLIEIQTYFN